MKCAYFQNQLYQFTLHRFNNRQKLRLPNKKQWLELKAEDRMMIDSVVWAQYINVTDTQTATLPEQVPRQRTASSYKKESEIIQGLYRQKIVWM